MPPYRRKRTYGRKRYGRRKTGFWNKRYSVGDIASKAWSTAKYLKSLINVEKKFFDVVSTASVGTGWGFVNLSNIAEGNDYNQRDGNSILCQSLQWRLRLDVNATALNNQFRVIIFSDNDNRGADPVIADLLESTGNPFTSPLLHYVNRRFNIISDKCYALTSTSETNTIQTKRYLKYHKHIKYQSTAGADASNWEGALYMAIVSDNNVNQPTYNFYSRLRYTDN